MNVVKLVAGRRREKRQVDWLDLLQHHPLFAGMSKRETERLSSRSMGSELTFAEDKVVFEAGEFGDSVYFIGAGSVSLSHPGEEHATLKAAALRRGDIFGEAVLFGSDKRATSATASRGCVLLGVPAADLRELMSQHPALELRLLRMMTERLQAENERILSAKLADVPEALRLFEARLAAEVRVFDATLKAAHAVFEQTRVRSDEVIGNAERTRSRLTYVGSSVISLFTMVGMALGGLGLREVWSLKNLRSDVAGAVATLEQFKKDGPGLMQEIDGMKKATEQAKGILVRSQIEGVQQALAEGTPSEAKRHFVALEQLGWTNDGNVLNLLYQVEAALISPRGSSGAVVKPEVAAGRSRQDFTDLILMMADRAEDPETKAKAYSLFLANAILVEKPKAERQAIEKRLRRLMDEHKGQLLKNEDWTPLQQRLGEKDATRRVEFERVTSLVPAS
jgi:CRP-like cAMP-binding protein